jgi:hypothetical protein
MAVSKKLFYDNPPKFRPSHWRSTNEYLDEEVHNDDVHGVKNDINYTISNAGSVENTEQIL